MVGLKLYVEGGGDSSDLRTACREGFASFIARAGIARRPRVVACGSRRNAFESFCTAVGNGQAAMLLVDSEGPVAEGNAQGEPDSWQPWAHLKQRPGDKWEKPENSNEADCHLMVQCMESWLAADPAALARFFGQGFNGDRLPKPANVETTASKAIQDALKQSTRECAVKGEYHKGRHSFRLLCCIDPDKISAASPWASRFLACLKSRMQE
ncbi:MAG: DUF4276 family protein [Acetobacteraceae bacterium]